MVGGKIKKPPEPLPHQPGWEGEGMVSIKGKEGRRRERIIL